MHFLLETKKWFIIVKFDNYESFSYSVGDAVTLFARCARIFIFPM
jgi:hypothetical protein